jgi:hypothetical protein
LRWAVLALALTGCGAGVPFQEYPFSYSYRNFVFHSTEEIPAEYTAKNVDRLCTLMVERLGIPFCEKAGTVHAYILQEDFTGLDGQRYTGMDVPFTNTIFISWTQRNLVHECLHLWDFRHVAVGSAWHEGWETNGYKATDQEFKRELSVLAIPHE